MKNNPERLKFGEGKISGAVAIFLASLSFFAIFCFKFPEVLTSPEFRELYTATSMKVLLTATIIASFIFTLVNFILNKKKNWGFWALLINALTIILGGFTVQGSVVEKTNWHLGLDWLLLDLLLMVIIFVPIEMIWPKRKEQPRFHLEWKVDLVYFVVSHLFIQFFGIITQQPAKLFFGWIGLDQFQKTIQELPFLFELFVAFFVTDFFQYWAHRIFHNYTYLWRFHSVHHSTENMDWLAGSRTHFVDIFFTRAMTFVPLYIFGFSSIVFNTYILFMAIHAVLIHSNTRINFGIFKYIFTTPQYHHWHHCKDSNHYGKNFATIFPFIDKMFGTYYLPNNIWPEETGLHEANFPKGYINQLVYPFTKSPFDNDLQMEEKSTR